MSLGSDGARIRRERRASQAQAFDRIGARYDEAFPNKEGQIEAGRWLIEQLRPGERVLDVGCGTGLPSARQLIRAGLQLTGIDISTGMLELARQNVPEATFHERDVLEFEGGGFQAAVAFLSLLMLTRAEIPAALARVRAALAPGGLLALSMVEADLDYAPLPILGGTVHVTGYPREKLRSVIEEAGFSVSLLWGVAYAPTSDEASLEIQLFAYCTRT